VGRVRGDFPSPLAPLEREGSVRRFLQYAGLLKLKFKGASI